MAAPSWGDFISRLPAEVRAMVDCLAEEEQETFSYLASYSAFDHHSTTSKGSKKQRGKHLHQQQQMPHKGNKEGHERAFGCECLDCYLKYWHLWVSSPNTQVIDKALELLELKSTSSSSTSTPSSSSRSSWKKPKPHKPKKSINKQKPKESPDRSCPQQDSGSKEEPGVLIDKKPSPPPGSSKPRSSKQVAPLDYSFKEGDLVEVAEDLEAGASGDGGGGGGGEIEVGGNRAPSSTGKSQSFGNRASEALGFACEKLLWMWNPRLRRRQ